MSGDELWLTRTFVSPTALGSATGVVLPAGAETPPSLLHTAQELQHAVTTFVIPRVQPLEWTTLAFSPGAELPVSIQAALAADAVLRHRFEVAPPSLSFHQPGRTEPLVVRRLPARPEISWARIPLGALEVGAPIAPLASVLGRNPAGSFPERTVRWEQARYYRQVSDLPALEMLHLTPDQAWTYLRHEGLTELCLYAWRTPREIFARVFSASLLGRERSAAPEAVAGLVQCLLPQGLSAEDEVTVQLGKGPSRLRSTVHLRVGRATQTVEVGGRVRLISRGHLMANAQRSSRRRA